MRSDSMGQVVFPLTSLKPKEKRDLWLPVLPKRPHEKISGEIRLIMSYEYIKVRGGEGKGGGERKCGRKNDGKTGLEGSRKNQWRD